MSCKIRANICTLIFNDYLPEFYEKESKYLYFREVIDNVNAHVIPLRFEICNCGHAPTGAITLELSFSKNAQVLTDDNRANYKFDRVDTPEFTTKFARQLKFPKLSFLQHDNVLYSWKVAENYLKDIYVFELSRPVLHNVRAEEIIENEFYIFVAKPQIFEIKWAIADSSLPEKISGTLKVIVK